MISERGGGQGRPPISTISFSRFITQTPACSLKERLSSHTKPAFNALLATTTTNIWKPNTEFSPHCYSVTFKLKIIQFKVIAPTMSSDLVLLILLCLTLHACDARGLQLSDEEKGKQVYHFSEDAENTKVFETSITSRLRPPTLEECISQQQEVKNNGRNSNDRRGGTVHKQNDPNVLYKKQEPTNGAPSGNENTKVSTFQKDLQLARNIKGLKRNIRSLQGSAQHDSVEAVDVKENEAVEDIVVMDYAQPHRKPPIHNEKP